MEILMEKILSLQEKLRSFQPAAFFPSIKQHFLRIIQQIKNIGQSPAMDDYESRKLGIFNLLNFFQLLSGTLIPLIGLLHNDSLPMSAWLLCFLPSSLSLAVLILNHFKKYQAGQL